MEKKKPKDGGMRFQRRDILKIAAGMPAAWFAAAPFTAKLAQAASLQTQNAEGTAAPATHPRALNAHEWTMIRTLSDLIIPADERSCSATQAGVPEFIDDWLSLERGDALAEMRGGLTWLDIECNRSFGNDFAECSAAQQKTILDRIAYPRKAAPEDAGAASFFTQLRDLVLSGFFVSETGIRDLPYLGNEPQSQWNGCPEAVLAQLNLRNDKSKA